MGWGVGGENFNPDGSVRNAGGVVRSYIEQGRVQKINNGTIKNPSSRRENPDTREGSVVVTTQFFVARQPKRQENPPVFGMG